MAWKIVDHITIYRDRSWYAAHPCIVRTSSGDLLTLFHRSTDLGYAHHAHPLFDLRACRSIDDGASWEEQHLVTCDPLGGVLDFGAHTLQDGSVFLHAATVELVPQGRSTSELRDWVSQPGIPFWIRSLDDGHTWTDPVRFPRLPEGFWGSPADNSGVCRSQLLQFPDGQILLPGKATDTMAEFRYFGMIQSSHDSGETWSYGGRIAEDTVAHFSEPAIHRTPSGRIMVLFRLHPNLPDDKDCRLAIVQSDDGGTTWTPWKRTTMKGCPGHLLGLRDSRIFATVGTRWAGQRGCLARVIDPEGSDIDDAPDIIVRADSSDNDCGYPWALQLSDEHVIVVYYYTYPDGTRGIEGTILEERT